MVSDRAAPSSTVRSGDLHYLIEQERCIALADQSALHLSVSEREIHVWTLSLDIAEERFRELEKFLSPTEIDRAEGYRVPGPRRRFVAARGMLREMLGHYLGVEPLRVGLDVNPWGKPILAGGAIPTGKTPSLHFNLAHSGELAVYAFGHHPLGVDVEQIRPLRNLDGMVRKSLSPVEQEAFYSIPPEQRLEIFFTTWARKEAYMKARGMGFHLSPKDFDVTVSPGERFEILRDAQYAGNLEDWLCCDLEVGETFAGAMVSYTSEGAKYLNSGNSSSEAV